MNKELRIKLFVVSYLLLVVAFSGSVLAMDATESFKQDQKAKQEQEAKQGDRGLRPDCNPTLAPDQPGACNISAFTVWVQKIIEWLFWISLPLALIFGIYGGFVIITAGGAEERFKHGKSILTAAIVGLLIVFLSNLIVSSIVKILTKGEL